jgi:hypothetical protein
MLASVDQDGAGATPERPHARPISARAWYKTVQMVTSTPSGSVAAVAERAWRAAGQNPLDETVAAAGFTAFVERVAQLPYVRGVAVRTLWGQHTLWTVVDAWAPDRLQCVLAPFVDVVTQFQGFQAECRVVYVDRAGEAEVERLLAGPHTTVLWQRESQAR